MKLLPQLIALSVVAGAAMMPPAAQAQTAEQIKKKQWQEHLDARAKVAEQEKLRARQNTTPMSEIRKEQWQTHLESREKVKEQEAVRAVQAAKEAEVRDTVNKEEALLKGGSPLKKEQWQEHLDARKKVKEEEAARAIQAAKAAEAAAGHR